MLLCQRACPLFPRVLVLDIVCCGCAKTEPVCEEGLCVLCAGSSLLLSLLLASDAFGKSGIVVPDPHLAVLLPPRHPEVPGILLVNLKMMVFSKPGTRFLPW